MQGVGEQRGDALIFRSSDLLGGIPRIRRV